MDKQHIIIAALGIFALILAIVLVSMKKKENYDDEHFDYGYPYQYATGFYPPPDGVILSTMKDDQFRSSSQVAVCKDAAMRYCAASSQPGSQKGLANNGELSQTLLDVTNSCGGQFPVKQFCAEQNPSYEMPDLVRGGLQHTPVIS